MKENLLTLFKRDLLPIAFLLGILFLVSCGTFAYQYVHTHTSQQLPELKELSGTTWSFQQYSTYFQKLADKKGAVYAYKVLLYAPFPPGIDLHLLGHVVGDMLYKQKGLNGIKDCTQDFRNACSHSVVIGYLQEHGEGSLPEIVKTCHEAPGGRGAYTMCFHGLGHGILAFTGYNFEKAIQMCKKTGSPEFHDREYIECAGGASMELMAGVHDRQVWESQKPKYFKDSDPLFPCDGSFVPDEVKPICYTHLTPHLFEAAGGDLGSLKPAVFGKAMSFCAAIPESRTEDRNACFGGFGKEYIVLAQGRDIRDVGSATVDALRPVRAACGQANDTQGERVCNDSALNSLFWGGENNPNAAFNYCAIAEGAAQQECYRGLVGNITFYLGGTPKAAPLCARLPEEYRNGCGAQMVR